MQVQAQDKYYGSVTFFRSSSCSLFDSDFLPMFIVPTSKAFSLLSDMVCK